VDRRASAGKWGVRAGLASIRARNLFAISVGACFEHPESVILKMTIVGAHPAVGGLFTPKGNEAAVMPLHILTISRMAASHAGDMRPEASIPAAAGRSILPIGLRWHCKNRRPTAAPAPCNPPSCSLASRQNVASAASPTPRDQFALTRHPLAPALEIRYAKTTASST